MSSGKTILIVDDDLAFRERLKRALEARGYVVLVADTLATSLAASGQGALLGAVVDLRMPQADGLEIVRELHAVQPRLPLVVLTGFGSIATALEAVRLGAKDYLTKPADPDQILAALLGTVWLGENPKEIPVETPSLDRVEWEYIQRVLADCGGNISQTARLLGINRRSLQRKLGKYPPPR